MKVPQMFVMLGMVVLSVAMLGCRAVGEEAEAKLGITAKEIRARNLTQTNGDGILTNATSFEMIQFVNERSKNSVGITRDRQYIELTRCLLPDYLSIGTIYSSDAIKRMIVNPRGVWEIDAAGASTQIKDKGALKRTRFILDMQNSAKKDEDLWRKIELEESELNPDTWYKLVFYPKGDVPGFSSRVEYINKNTFLCDRNVLYFVQGIQLTTDIEEYKSFGSMKIPYMSISYDKGNENISRRVLKSFKINCLNKDCICEFEPDAKLNMTIPGCRACGEKAKPRTYYEFPKK